MVEDLHRSGLSDATIAAMGLTELTAKDCLSQLRWAWDGIPNGGYKIPYFDLEGKRTSFFRVRFTPAIRKKGGGLIRYGQPKDSTTRAYLPPLPWCREAWRDVSVPLVITEGEKKAAKACQEGILTVGLGGVNSWLRRKFEVKTSKTTPHPDDPEKLILTLVDAKEIRMVKERVAEELIDIPLRGRQLFVCFDNDREPNVRVQQAAFDLSTWSEEQDAIVQQILLPPGPTGEKIGLDDFLLSHSAEAFWGLQRWNVVPEYLKSWLREQLDGSRKLNRSGVISCGRAVSNFLLNNGQAYRDRNTGKFYYYDSRCFELHEFELGSEALKQLHDNTFGGLLHREFALDESDRSVLSRTFGNLAHAPTLRDVSPRRVSFAAPEAVYYQLSDSHLARITAGAIEVVPNGTDDVLFIKGQIEPAGREVLAALEAAPIEPLWLGTVNELVTLQPMEGLTIEETRLFLAVLCYLSPWLRKWRGLELPIEVLCGEPASGKSSLYKLRRGILTGSQRLDKTPVDLRGWNVTLTHAPGLFVCDNIDKIPKDLEATFSTDLCYYVTEVDPRIEIPKLYKTNVVYRAPVDCCFAFPCVSSPVHKPDLVQRTFEFRMLALPEGAGDSGWVDAKIAGAGRAGWLVDQFRALQRFLQIAETNWRPQDTTQNRLRYFDQAVALMGEAIGRGAETAALIPKLRLAGAEALVEADPGARALRTWAEEAVAAGKSGEAHPYRCADVIRWRDFGSDGRFSRVHILTNVESLSRYLRNHQSDLRKSCGIDYRRDKRNSLIIVIDPNEEKK
jgi:hypothetical protein